MVKDFTSQKAALVCQTTTHNVEVQEQLATRDQVSVRMPSTLEHAAPLASPARKLSSFVSAVPCLRLHHFSPQLPQASFISYP